MSLDLTKTPPPVENTLLAENLGRVVTEDSPSVSDQESEASESEFTAADIKLHQEALPKALDRNISWIRSKVLSVYLDDTNGRRTTRGTFADWRADWVRYNYSLWHKLTNLGDMATALSLISIPFEQWDEWIASLPPELTPDTRDATRNEAWSQKESPEEVADKEWLENDAQRVLEVFFLARELHQTLEQLRANSKFFDEASDFIDLDTRHENKPESYQSIVDKDDRLIALIDQLNEIMKKLLNYVYNQAKPFQIRNIAAEFERFDRACSRK